MQFICNYLQTGFLKSNCITSGNELQCVIDFFSTSLTCFSAFLPILSPSEFKNRLIHTTHFRIIFLLGMKFMPQNAVPCHNLLLPCILITPAQTWGWYCNSEQQLWVDKTVRKVLSCATLFSRLLKGVCCLPPSQSISF